MQTFQGTQKCKELINKNKYFFIYGDPDIDGLYATKLTIDFLKMQNKQYTYYINSNRQHGFLLDMKYIAKLKGACIIAVDFAISAEIIQQIVSMGVSIVSIDHHEIVSVYSTNCYFYDSCTGAEGIIINNQYAFEPIEHKYLSGAGVCYTIYSEIDSAFITQAHQAYVGITLLSDACAIENSNAQRYLSATYTWRDAESTALISMAMSEKQKRYASSVQRYLDREFLDYNFNPTLNALCRCNEQLLALNAIMQPQNYKDFTQYIDWQKQVVQSLQETAERTDYTNLIVYTIDVEEIFRGTVSMGNFIGIIANRLLNEYQKTVLILLTCNGVFVRGSVRGYMDSVNYLQIAQECNIACEGHQQAFGVVAMPQNQGLYAEKIKQAEQQCKLAGRTTAIYIDVPNLAHQTIVDKKSAEYNLYVRSNHMVYYDCSKCAWDVHKVSKTGAYTEYNVDGVIVQSFTRGLTPATGVILPRKTNGYMKYSLERRLI